MSASAIVGGNNSVSNTLANLSALGDGSPIVTNSHQNFGDDVEGDPPLWKFHEHTAAVKALAWDPHVSGVLATGGGTQDKTIRFWNVFNGTMLNDLDTGSQVRELYFESRR